MTALNEAMARLGRPGKTAEDLAAYLRGAGFVDVHVRRFKQPYGPWAKDKTLKQAGAMGMPTARCASDAG